MKIAITKLLKNIHDNINEVIEEHKAVSSAPVMLDKTEVKEILEKAELPVNALLILKNILKWQLEKTENLQQLI